MVGLDDQFGAIEKQGSHSYSNWRNELHLTAFADFNVCSLSINVDAANSSPKPKSASASSGELVVLLRTCGLENRHFHFQRVLAFN